MANKREKADYEKILKTILEMLDNEVAVEEVVTDFEKATWRAFQSVFPDARLFGCAFHWTQALFRNLKKMVWSIYIATTPMFRRFVSALCASTFYLRPR
jgi:transposase-like protein